MVVTRMKINVGVLISERKGLSRSGFPVENSIIKMRSVFQFCLGEDTYLLNKIESNTLDGWSVPLCFKKNSLIARERITNCLEWGICSIRFSESFPCVRKLDEMVNRQKQRPWSTLLLLVAHLEECH